MREWSGRKPRVLVVGWGFLGAAVGVSVLQRGGSVRGLTRSESLRVQAARALGIEVAIGDARDRATVERSMDGVEHVVYVAGGLDPPTAAERPLDDAMAALPPLLSTLEAIRRRAGARFTYISSGGAVYGNPPARVATEADPAMPISPYGASRLAGEVYSQMYARTCDITTQIVRCANVYGPGQSDNRPQGAVAVFLSRVAAGLTVSIVGDGASIRDYVYVNDVTSAIAQLVVDGIDCGVVNIGSGSGHSVVDLLGVVGETVGRSPITVFVPRRPHDVDAIVLDVSKIRSLVSYEPMTLVDGVRATWDARHPVRGVLDATSHL